MARIVIRLSIELNIDAERALDIFYHTRVYKMMCDPKYGLQIMSDGYIIEDIMHELQYGPAEERDDF